MFGWVFSVRVFLFWPSSLCVINAVSYFIETLPIWVWVFSVSIEEKSLILSVSAELDSLKHCQLLNLGGWELVCSPVPFPLIYLLLLYAYEWFACMHVCVPPVCLLDPLELGLQSWANPVDARIELMSFTRATCILSCWTIFPDPVKFK